MCAREGAISLASSFRKRVGMESCPGLFLMSSFFSSISTSLAVVVMSNKHAVLTVSVVTEGSSNGIFSTDCRLCWMKYSFRRLAFWAGELAVVVVV